MADALTPGILVEEIAGRETSLDAFRAGITAFIGATPRGPLDEAVIIDSPEEMERRFGAAGGECPLQRCVEDFFHAGGTRAVVVRVANGAASCTIRLPGREGDLVLEAVSPGRREFLRASVDYDHIGLSDDATFNLVVQRLRSPGTERVTDQEIYRRLSTQQSAETHVADALLTSRLARVRGAVPPSRPAATVSTAPGYPVTWVDSRDDGADGRPPTDYDLIGSSVQGTGLFALDGVEPIDFLCLPTAGGERGPGPALLLAALRYCRVRRSMLLLEPPAGTEDGEQALAWLRSLNIVGENAMAVFPRLAEEGRRPGRSAAGAVAGALTRSAAAAEPAFGAQFRPIAEFTPEVRRRLHAAGMNVIGRGPGGKVVLEGDRTLAPAGSPVQAWRALSARRLAMGIERALLQGTRWVVFEPAGPALAQRLRLQLAAWLESLRIAGLLAGGPGEAWLVDVNEVSAPHRAARIDFTVGFAPRRPGDFVIYRVSQGLHGARLANVSPERWVITQPPPGPEIPAASLGAAAG
jgi:uncharacterized protein